MFAVRSGREEPSVVSTRVLRTHRKNSMENFWLQERVKTIDNESQQNYSQISDEIDGVRQNLIKINIVKKNVGFSVERRKFLRDKGLRILPSKQNGTEDFFTLRTADGKDLVISCAEFYDGDAMRKQLCIDARESTTTPFTEAESSFSEDQIDATSDESRIKRNATDENEQMKNFRHRKITPPLRPGSIRNFKDVDRETPIKDDKLVAFEAIVGAERKCGILRKQTTHTKRQVLEPEGRLTCPASNDITVTTPRRKLSGNSAESVSNSRKKSRVNHPYETDTNSVKESTGQQLVDSNSEQYQCNNSNMALERKISMSSFVRPLILRRSISDRGGTPSCFGSSSALDGFRKMSVVIDKTMQLCPTPLGGKWTQRNMSAPEVSTLDRKKDTQTVQKDNDDINQMIAKVEVSLREDQEKEGREIPKLPERQISCDNYALDSCNNNIEKNRSSIDSQPSHGLDLNFRTRDVPQLRRPSTARYSENCSSGKVSKTTGKQSSHDVVCDSRPGKTLKKRFVTMQMTIGNKQVKVYVPKFSRGEYVEHENHRECSGKVGCQSSRQRALISLHGKAKV